MAYPFIDIERKWQKHWAEKKTFRAENTSSKPKYYVLDMFPYPSGAGLHVGHPLGYIASDIVARYKRLKGFNVLHPMGYDSFGLPAEQYAIQTGQHPAVTTESNIARYREQMDKIGFSFDWSREVRTSDPNYYKWTQWIFLKLFNSWYNPTTNKAEDISTLIEKLNTNSLPNGQGWAGASTEKEKSDLLMNYRLAYLSEAWVNWCPQLGTVLANEEVKDGVSERGGYPVERKLMPQWSLRITAYAERLLNDLETIDWSDSIKESQRNWIGRSEGSSLRFKVANSKLEIEVFTTRPDTIFGVTFLTLAPENEIVLQITTPEQKAKVDAYITYAKNRSERDRQADVKKITGEFTGAYALHPFTGKKIPVWIGDYVLATYGTGAVMAVPSSDERDHKFAKHFDIPVIHVIEGTEHLEDPCEKLHGTMINSDFLNGMESHAAIKRCIQEIEKRGLGKGKTQFRLRDAIFGRQRYWGEPIPMYYENGIPKAVDEKHLPVILPEVDKYIPTEAGEPPLARAKDWKYKNKYEFEKTTMPGWAGSSWYYLRYMDANNEKEFAGKDAINYWQNVDLYIGGAEHATGHLLYIRFWTKFLNDLGFIPVTEPAKKLINQGMIQGMSAFVYRVNGTNKFVSYNLRKEYDTTAVHIDVCLVENSFLNMEIFKKHREDFTDAEFILEDGKYVCGHEVEKMSKSKLNVVTPDAICNDFGADTLRLYEMFLGPLEMSKPWSTQGISGVFGFLNRFWRLFHKGNEFDQFVISGDAPTKPELKILHKTIKKIQEDIESYSFNTSVSAFMICANELTELKCNKRAILEPLVILLSPFAPHIAEELWEKLGHKESISFAPFPQYNEAFTIDDSFAYPVSFNGKMRFNLELSLSLSPAEIEKEVMAFEQTLKYLEGKQPKKVIVVPKKIVNIVI
ncbi:MAG TPA: leucine--tRNA ligase [Bacteroidia bacterium]|nr:leucine--tRNA ligase [Bacteroidia bacterium]